MTYSLHRFCLAFVLASLVGLSSVYGQQSRTIFVNGGRFEFQPPFTDNVTVAYWDAPNRVQVPVDTLPAQSVTDAVTSGDTLYVATDFLIRAYKLPGFQEIASSRTLKGVRKVAKAGNRLLATRGFGTPSGGSLLLSLNATTLAVLDSIPVFEGELEHLLVDGRRAFVGAPGSFLSDSGNVLEVNLSTYQVQNTYLLGRLGQGVGRLFKHNNDIWAYCSRGFGYPRGGLAKLGAAGSFVIDSLPYSVGYSAVYYRAGRAFGDLGGGGLGVASSNLQTLLPTPRYARPMAAAAYDPIQNRYIITTADYTSPGKAIAISGNTGQVLDSLPIGIAPEAVVFWDASLTRNKAEITRSYTITPNPSATTIALGELLAAGFTDFRVVDMTGKALDTVIQKNEVLVEGLPRGVYQLVASGKGKSVRLRFVKE